MSSGGIIAGISGLSRRLPHFSSTLPELIRPVKHLACQTSPLAGTAWLHCSQGLGHDHTREGCCRTLQSVAARRNRSGPRHRRLGCDVCLEWIAGLRGGEEDPSGCERSAAMFNSDPAYLARRPRHLATGGGGLDVTVRRSSRREPRLVEAELLNLSRRGVQLRVAAELEVRESVTLQLASEASDLQLTRSAEVRWRHPEPSGAWTVGCMFARQVDLETLGELFLSELLATDPPGPSFGRSALPRDPSGPR